MLKSVQMVVPFLAWRWCLEDLFETCGDTSIPILLIDNSPNSEAKTMSRYRWPDTVTVEYFPENLGVGASWNRGLRLGADQTLICSEMVRFAPMDTARRKGRDFGLDVVAERINEFSNKWGMSCGDQGFHLISIGRETVDAIGYFNENIFAYGEDDDYWHRVTLAGIELGTWEAESFFASGIHSIGWAAHLREGVTDLPQTGDAYFKKKWQSVNKEDSFTYPFNDRKNGLDYWPEVKR